MVGRTWTSSVKYETKGMIQAICFRSVVVDELKPIAYNMRFKVLTTMNVTYPEM
jgi:hypothetical protein